MSETKMETVDACAALSDDAVIAQIRLRHHWINNVLHGWLYKDVLASEIDKLQGLLDARQGKPCAKCGGLGRVPIPGCMGTDGMTNCDCPRGEEMRRLGHR